MPPAAIGLGVAGALIGGIGAARNAKKKPLVTQFVPEDILGLRGRLARLFTNQLPGGLTSIGADPLSQAVASNFQSVLSPEFREGLFRSPEDFLGQIGAARRPIFEENLNNTLLGISSRFGPQGHRIGVSSDLNRQLATQGRLGEAQFESSLLDLLPALDANAANRLGAFANLANAGSQFALGQSQLALTPIELATRFGTSFPGGQVTPRESGTGAFLETFGGGLSAIGSGLAARG